MSSSSDCGLREMVERVAWMSPIDYEILGFFAEHDIRVTPRVLAKNIDYDRNYTGKRCREFEKRGLLTSEGGFYELTELARGFLAGKVDPVDLE